jgi:hypothetical protein
LQTHDTTFSEKILDFYKILEESEQFFILFFKENGKSEAVLELWKKISRIARQ